MTSASERARIRELFLHPRDAYAIAEVATILRLSDDEVRKRVADGSVETVDCAGESRVPWQELIGFAAAERWTPRLLAQALPVRMVPRLARSCRGAIVLPRYAWKLLRVIASEASAAEERELTVSDLIEHAVHGEFVEGMREWETVEERIAGIRSAAAWPGAERRHVL